MERKPARADDAVLDVLLLGASVLTSGYGEVPDDLERALRERSQRPVAVHNLARPGFSTRDSLLKYRLLDEQRFDVVLIYHGINELRANNVPAERFRDDYGHMNWYREVNFAAAHPILLRFTTLPLTALEAGLVFGDWLGIHPAIGIGRPRKEYMRFGSDVKSALPFERNLREILKLAHERGDPVVLSTFAFYVPPDYSYERFRARELDYRYQKRFVPLEVWGKAEYVLEGLRAHQAVLRRLASEGRAARFVDMAAAIPGQGRYWSDACHLSAEGSERFAERLAPELLAAARAPAAGAEPTRSGARATSRAWRAGTPPPAPRSRAAVAASPALPRTSSRDRRG